MNTYFASELYLDCGFQEDLDYLVLRLEDPSSPYLLICSQHQHYSTIKDSHCPGCSRESRNKTYQQQKDGTYVYINSFGTPIRFERKRLSSDTSSTQPD